jgi:hypothetical protein
MDGYAVIADDVASATPEHPVLLPVAEDIPAGRTDVLTLKPGYEVPQQRLVARFRGHLAQSSPRPRSAPGAVVVHGVRRPYSSNSGAGVDNAP